MSTGFYRELKTGEITQHEDERLALDGRWFSVATVGVTVAGDHCYRRPIPEPEQPSYRELAPDERVQAGDEVHEPNANVWFLIKKGNMRIGERAGPEDRYRRKVGAEQPNNLHVHPTDPNIRFGVNLPPAPDMVNEPPHYRQHASGIECIQVTEGMNFCLGNAIKYIWRAGLKGDPIKDLEKARWYLNREIERLQKP